MAWLITGGAGYIGSHVVASAKAAGYDVVIIDDLSTGFTDRIPEGVPFVHADIADREAVRAAIREHNITGVVHLAARKQVGESMADPYGYWEWNVSRMITFLDELNAGGVRHFVYSSSAAVYGNPADGLTPLTEDSPCVPINPYGATKLAGEVLIDSLAKTGRLNGISLRYFNVAGTLNGQLADRLALNLVPIVLTRLQAGQTVSVFGTDYETADGTCIRDYVHVVDLAEAHVAAMQKLEGGFEGHLRLNIGTGTGASVIEVVEALESATGQDIPWEDTGRREGDPTALVANVDAARSALGWSSKRGLTEICDSAWEFWPGR